MVECTQILSTLFSPIPPNNMLLTSSDHRSHGLISKYANKLWAWISLNNGHQFQIRTENCSFSRIILAALTHIGLFLQPVKHTHTSALDVENAGWIKAICAEHNSNISYIPKMDFVVALHYLRACLDH